MVVKNITTSISYEKTIMEIEIILVKFGAKAIMKEYDNQTISAISFYIEYDGQRIPFKLPMSLEKSRTVIVSAVNERKLAQRYLSEPLRSDQARRVGWRIIKDWIHSNLSLIEMNFATPIEILFPYVYDYAEKKTIYEKFIKNKSKYIALNNNENNN